MWFGVMAYAPKKKKEKKNLMITSFFIKACCIESNIEFI